MRLPVPLFLTGTVLAATACAPSVIAPFDARHPASPRAAESPARPISRLLGSDEETRRTHSLLARRTAEAKAAKDEPSTDETNIAHPEAMPAAHDHQP